MDALTAAVADLASGTIDESGFRKVAGLHALLHGEKVAFDIPADLKKKMFEHVMTGAAIAIPTLAAGALMQAGTAAARAGFEAATKGRDLQRILDVYPHLRENYSAADIDLAYNSMRHMNPHVAKDPLTGGTLLGQMLRSRDPLNPASLRFEPDLAMNLLRGRPQEDHSFDESLRDGVMRAMTQGASEAASSRAQAAQIDSQVALDKARAGREEARFKLERADSVADRLQRARESGRTIAHGRRTELLKHENAMAKMRAEAALRARAEGRRRVFDAAQKDSDRVNAVENTIRQAILAKAGPDVEYARDLSGNPVIGADGLPHTTAAPQISHVLEDRWPHLRKLHTP